MKKRKVSVFDVVAILAVIAVLAMIIPPAMTDARARAMEAACMFSTKQIGDALKAYVSDWQGAWPAARIFLNKGYSASDTDPNGYMRTGMYQYGGVASLLYPYTRNWNVFWCPLDPTNRPYKGEHQWTDTVYRQCVFMFSGYTNRTLRDPDFARPAGQVIYHEMYAFHHGGYIAWQTVPVKGRPILISLCADGHVLLWTLPYKGGQWPYDPNFFTQGNKANPNYYWDPRIGWDF